MLDSTIFESFAHYASCMATIAFGIWAVILYKCRKRNRMTYLLFLAIAYIALSFIKDAIFRLPSQVFSDFYFVENLVSIIDISFVPFACAFFIEATRPGFVTNRRLLSAFVAFFAFIPLYCIFHSQWVVVGSFTLSLVAALATIVAVSANVVRYSKYLSDNYSFIKGISVKWCLGCTFGFFLWLVFYQVCFYKPTWFGEMIYDAGFLVIWNIVCLRNRSHQVVVGMMAFNELTDNAEPRIEAATQTTEELVPTPAEEPEPAQDGTAPKQSAATCQAVMKDSFIADSLQRCMETEKLYLNPRLSLTDLAMAAGTNKTYISIYINGLGKTFYDYVNEFRIAEACRIIDGKPKGERLSMSDVAAQSGFNSISTFNRYFSKLKGVTPSAYSRR